MNDPGFVITEPELDDSEVGDPNVGLLSQLAGLDHVNLVDVPRSSGRAHTVMFATHSVPLGEPRTVDSVTGDALVLADKLVETANTIREAVGGVPRAPAPGLRCLTDNELMSTAIILLSGINTDEPGDAVAAGEAVVDYLLTRTGSDAMVPLVLVVDDPGADISTIDVTAGQALFDALTDRFAVD